MKNKIKTICFDIDQIICVTNKNFYNFSKPKKKTIKYINTLYKDGYIIKIFTARYMGTYKENISYIKKKYYKKTFNQLKKCLVQAISPLRFKATKFHCLRDATCTITQIKPIINKIGSTVH